MEHFSSHSLGVNVLCAMSVKWKFFGEQALRKCPALFIEFDLDILVIVRLGREHTSRPFAERYILCFFFTRVLAM